MDDRCYRRIGRSWHRYDRGRRSGDRHVVRGHRGSAGAQRHTASRTVRFDLSGPVPPVGQNRPLPSGPPMDTVFERIRAIGAAAISAADLQRAMGAFGLESDATFGPAATEQRRAMVAARLPRQQWPDRPMIVTAVNAHTGELAAFDRDSGVDLVDAVTASTALPGVVPTHNINGTRYINGGVRSGRKRRPRQGLCERRGDFAVWRTDRDTTGRPVRRYTQITGRGRT